MLNYTFFVVKHVKTSTNWTEVSKSQQFSLFNSLQGNELRFDFHFKNFYSPNLQNSFDYGIDVLYFPNDNAERAICAPPFLLFILILSYIFILHEFYWYCGSLICSFVCLFTCYDFRSNLNIETINEFHEIYWSRLVFYGVFFHLLYLLPLSNNRSGCTHVNQVRWHPINSFWWWYFIIVWLTFIFLMFNELEFTIFKYHIIR